MHRLRQFNAFCNLSIDDWSGKLYPLYMTIVKGGLMNLTVRGIRYNPSDETRAFLDKKLQKLQFAEGYLHDLDIVITRETVGQGFHIDAKLHFSWGTIKMVSYDCYELYEGIELITDKIEATARKEKGKIKEH